METTSYHVSCATLAVAAAVLARCHAEGFKAVASQNLNGAGYIVEYWK